MLWLFFARQIANLAYTPFTAALTALLVGEVKHSYPFSSCRSNGRRGRRGRRAGPLADSGWLSVVFPRNQGAGGLSGHLRRIFLTCALDFDLFPQFYRCSLNQAVGLDLPGAEILRRPPVPVRCQLLRCKPIYWLGIVLLLWLFPANSLLAGGLEPIRFAPLPLQNRAATALAFLPMVRHLESELGRPVELVYFDRHSEVLAAFEAGDIQLVFLGPLPYLTLLNKSAAIEPVIFFREESGLAQYRCALIGFLDDITTIYKKTNLKIGLTQALSTCGYLGAKAVLADWRGLDLDALDYVYLGTHEQVALAVVSGQVDVGSVRDEFVNHYAKLGVTALAYSDWLPAVGLYAHRELLGEETILAIRNLLLATPADIYRNWGTTISHGMVQLSERDLQSLYAIGDPLSIPPPPPALPGR